MVSLIFIKFLFNSYSSQSWEIPYYENLARLAVVGDGVDGLPLAPASFLPQHGGYAVGLLPYRMDGDALVLHLHRSAVASPQNNVLYHSLNL